jgi:hypothetical protein
VTNFLALINPITFTITLLTVKEREAKEIHHGANEIWIQTVLQVVENQEAKLYIPEVSVCPKEKNPLGIYTVCIITFLLRK